MNSHRPIFRFCRSVCYPCFPYPRLARHQAVHSNCCATPVSVTQLEHPPCQLWNDFFCFNINDLSRCSDLDSVATCTIRPLYPCDVHVRFAVLRPIELYQHEPSTARSGITSCKLSLPAKPGLKRFLPWSEQTKLTQQAGKFRRVSGRPLQFGCTSAEVGNQHETMLPRLL